MTPSEPGPPAERGQPDAPPREPPPPLPPAAGESGALLGEVGEAAVARLRAEQDRRLHPLSWLFVLLGSLRQFALPLIAFVVFGQRADEDELWFQAMGLAAGLLLTLGAVARYYTYRFRIERGVLVVRSGLLSRNLRQIPLTRIQNVALKQGLLHRALGVADVRLESAVGGGTPEAQMQVLSLADAAALEAVVQAAGAANSTSAGEVAGNAALASVRPAAASEGQTLLGLDTAELVKLGLTSNRGLVLGAVGFGAFAQFGGEGFGRTIANTAEAGVEYAGQLGLGWPQWLLLGFVLLLAFLAVARAVAVLLVVLQFHGFRLVESAGSLGVEQGLLTRLRMRAPLAKIQRWTVYDSLLHRFFDRRSVRVETAALQAVNEQQALSDVIPIAAPTQVDALIERWLPDIDWGGWTWQPLHPRAWRRVLFPSLLLIGGLTALAALRFGPSALLLPVLLLPLAVLRARGLAKRCGWVLTDRVLAWRSGWLDRHVSFAEVHRLQGLRLSQSPFDRRHGMATLYADTAGSSPFTHQLELRYLPEAEARALFAELSRRIAKRRLQW
ncbi:PH domain-containing protein [Aquimonas voraii]|uniref:Putative membrane protein n=1 Tax=Aquimonas voraii TaxID=265719 RepID=A0A1G6YPC3_9GAMM|nr:PH domain-containing protein [Aquimonas voraii]SDD92142.1 putative membrane protein [Aquimonas voraii]